jgi:predicted NUDIX family phosphoesterase
MGCDLATEERVFCLKRVDLDCLLGARGNGVEIADLLALPQYFLPRRRAENDPSYKQLIPYQLFRRGDGFFVYQRGKKVGEQRLAGRLSLGIGGHINSDDASHFLLSPQTYQEALQRERCEELTGLPPCDPLFIGLINDDSDAVSAVHLGAVHLSVLSLDTTPTIRGAGEDLQSRGFWTAATIEQEANRFERWSLLALALAERFSTTIQNE